MHYGLIRVSTRDQNEDRQLAEMKKQGVPFENIEIEKTSGKTINRKKYKDLKKKLTKGDTLFIHSVDRLGRNYNEILSEWFNYWRDNEVKIIFISSPLLNTNKKCTSLLEIFTRDLFLIILAYVAEQEYKNIKERAEQGIAIAKEKGVKFGRPKKKLTKNQLKILNQWSNNEITPVVAMKKLKLKKSAFYKLANEVLGGDEL